MDFCSRPPAGLTSIDVKARSILGSRSSTMALNSSQLQCNTTICKLWPPLHALPTTMQQQGQSSALVVATDLKELDHQRLPRAALMKSLA